MAKFTYDRWGGRLVARTVWLRGYSNGHVEITLEALDNDFYATVHAGQQVLGESGWRKNASVAIREALVDTRAKLFRLVAAADRLPRSISSARARRFAARERRESRAAEKRRAAAFRKLRAKWRRQHKGRK